MRVINVPVVKNGVETIQQEKIYEIEELAYLGKLLHCKDVKKRELKKTINYLQIPCAFDIETTNIEDDQWSYRDEEVYEYLKKCRLRYDDNFRRSVTDFDYIRKAYFNQIKMSKTKGSYIDVLYEELHQYRPDLFPNDIIAPQDQFFKILDVYDANRPLKKGEFRPYAFMYHWQFCFGDQVVFGRTWQDMRKLFRSLEQNLNLSFENRLVIYSHNLSFEWQFMRRFVKVVDGFFTEKYKPLKIILDCGIELRCSQMLSNMRLEKFCENEKDVIHYKLKGEEYDYSIIRTPSYTMSEYEEGYCYNDVRGLSECIASRLNEFDIAHIPLTSTGYVRLDARKAMATNKRNRQLFRDLALDLDLYRLCRKAFRGGDTHANNKKVNRVIYNVQSFDITSSYPTSMVIDKYPMTAFSKITLETFYNLDFNEEAVLMEIMLTNVRYKGNCFIPYIPVSKCTQLSDKRIEDNGRVMKAEYLSIVCTEIDYQIIMDEYDFDDIGYNTKNMYAAKKGYLPAELREVVMKYYRLKTQLKGVKGKEYEYNRAKERLNALYGMLVMRIDQSSVKYEDGKYVDSFDDLTPEQIDAETKKLLEKYYNSRNNFLSYQWGVWVTCNSRLRLRKMLRVVGKDVCYVDTDSIKCVNDHRKDFDKINEEIKKQAIEAGAYATNKDGKTYYLGTWDFEGTYTRFKTLGSKKYLVEYWGENEDTGEPELKIASTIAGVNKKVGAAYFKKHGFSHFTIGEEIPKSGHLVAFYNDDDIHEVIIDGEHIETASNLAIINDEYTLGVSDSLEYLLAHFEQNIEDLEYV